MRTKSSLAKSSLVLLSLLALLLLPLRANAEIHSLEGTYTLKSDEVIDDDLFLAAEQASIMGTVNGDVFVGAGTVEIDGIINGDVYAAGGLLRISGKVQDDVILAGGSLEVYQAEIGDSLLTFGGSIVVDEETKIGGSYVVGGGFVTLSGEVARGIVGGAGSLTIKGKVGKDVNVGAEQLTIGATGVIGGTVNYVSEQDIVVHDGAQVAGEVKKTVPDIPKADQAAFDDFAEVFQQARFGYLIWAYFATLVVGVFVIRLLKSPTDRVVEQINNEFWPSLGWGALIILLSVPVAVILFMTVIGIQLALLLGTLLFIAVYLAKIFVSICLGSWLIKQLNMTAVNIYLSFALGLMVYFLLTNLPFYSVLPLVSFIIQLGAVFVGVGAIWLVIKNSAIVKR